MNSRKKCRVCGDKALGFNFNGLSCESCRLFFIRNAYRHENLYCQVNLGKCEITLECRNCCQRCRMDKCVAIGMRKELIKGRYSVQNMNSNLIGYSPPQSDSSSSSSSSPPHERHLYLTLPETTYDKTILLNETGIFTRQLQMYELERLREVQGAMSVFCEETSLEIVRPSHSLVDAYNFPDQYIRRIINFCKNIQAFNSLLECDQLVMLKEFFSNIQTVRFSFVYNLQKNPLFLAEDELESQGRYIKVNIFRQLKRRNMESFFQKMLYSLQVEMEDDDIVRNLFIAHSLFRPREDVTNPELIRYHYHVYSHLLIRYFEHKYRDHELASSKYSSLMQLLNEMSQVNKLCKEVFADANCDQTNEVLDEIFLEK